MSTILQRLVRRETHSPRTVAAIVALVILAVAMVTMSIEIILQLRGSEPMLVSPSTALHWLMNAPRAHPRIAMAAGAGAALIGVLMIWLAVSPGRRSNHQLGNVEHAIVADNAVIADAIARQVRYEIALPLDGVVVGVGHRTVDVTLRPELGDDIDQRRVHELVETELSSYAVRPSPRVHVRVQRRRVAEVIDE